MVKFLIIAHCYSRWQGKVVRIAGKLCFNGQRLQNKKHTNDSIIAFSLKYTHNHDMLTVSLVKSVKKDYFPVFTQKQLL